MTEILLYVFLLDRVLLCKLDGQKHANVGWNSTASVCQVLGLQVFATMPSQ